MSPCPTNTPLSSTSKAFNIQCTLNLGRGFLTKIILGLLDPMEHNKEVLIIPQPLTMESKRRYHQSRVHKEAKKIDNAGKESEIEAS